MDQPPPAGPPPAGPRSGRLEPGEPRLVVLKIGGSLLSDKRAGGGTDASAIADFALLVKDLVETFPGRVVLVTGGGALCHAVGLRVDRGEPFSAVALTEPAFAMKWAWTAELRRLGVAAMPLQVAAMCVERPGEGVVANLEVVHGLLARGALPVLASDCVLTPDGSLRILSSDHVPGILVTEELAPVRIVTLTDVPGILTGTGPDSPVLDRLDPDDLSGVAELFWPTDEWDATGAMAGKVEALVEHARRGAECVIARGDRHATDLRHLFSPVDRWPADLPRTLIAVDPVRQPAPVG